MGRYFFWLIFSAAIAAFVWIAWWSDLAYFLTDKTKFSLLPLFVVVPAIAVFFATVVPSLPLGDKFLGRFIYVIILISFVTIAWYFWLIDSSRLSSCIDTSSYTIRDHATKTIDYFSSPALVSEEVNAIRRSCDPNCLLNYNRYVTQKLWNLYIYTISAYALTSLFWLFLSSILKIEAPSRMSASVGLIALSYPLAIWLSLGAFSHDRSVIKAVKFSIERKDPFVIGFALFALLFLALSLYIRLSSSDSSSTGYAKLLSAVSYVLPPVLIPILIVVVKEINYRAISTDFSIFLIFVGFLTVWIFGAWISHVALSLNKQMHK